MSGNIFKKVLKHGIKSLNAPKYTNDGISLVKQNRLKEAEYAYLQAIEADPNYAQAYFCLGHLLEGQNRLREAEQAYHKAIESGQDNDQIAQVYTNLGALLENQNRLTEAENAYCEAVSAYPSCAAAYYNYGNLLMNQGRLKEAEDNYQRTISINPNFALAHLNLGVLLQRNNHLKEAEQSYNRAIFADPNLAQPHFNLGRLFEGQSRLREAEQAYRKAIAADPNYAQAYVNLNVLLENQNRLTEADQAYQAFLGADTPLDMEKAVIHFPSLADDKFIDQLKNAEMPKSLDFDTAFRNQLYYSKKVLWLEQVAREDQFVNALIDFDVEDFKSDSFRTRCLRTYMFAPSLDVSHELGFQAFLCTRSISELKKVAKNFPYMLNDKSFVTGIEYVIQSLPKHEHPEALQERLDALKQIQKNLTL